jgi:rod shape-determining protein MreD
VLPDRRQQILLPVRLSTIVVSFGVALLVNFLPWYNVALAPDFVALTLTFWCVRQPQLIGLGVAWMLGLLTDVGNGVLLGQHALSYSVLAFCAVTLSRRVLWFGLWGQTAHVAVLLLIAQAVGTVVRLAAGAEFPGWTLAIGPLGGALLWPLVSVLLLAPQRGAREVDDTRPI